MVLEQADGRPGGSWRLLEGSSGCWCAASAVARLAGYSKSSAAT